MARYVLSLLAGIVAGVLLFLLMNELISNPGSIPDDDQDLSFVDFIHVPEEEEVRTKERQKPEEPPPPERPPPPPEISQQAEQQPQTPQLDINMPNFDVPFGVQGGPFVQQGGRGQGSGDVVPIVAIEPQWPREALMRGIEGYVVVEFTILEDGTVANPEVVEADPPRLFNRNAIRAIMKWKFKPRMVDGKPTTRRATQTIEFDLDDAQTDQ